MDGAIPWGEKTFFTGKRFVERCVPQTLEIDGVESNTKVQGIRRVDDFANLPFGLVIDPIVDAGN